MGIEPTSSAWKAEVLAFELHPQLTAQTKAEIEMVEGGGFEPPKAEPADLQSAPFDRSGTPPITNALKSIYIYRSCLKPGNIFNLLKRRLQISILIISGARRGTRTHDLLILTYYRFRDLSLESLGSGLSLHPDNQYALGGRCKVSTLSINITRNIWLNR